LVMDTTTSSDVAADVFCPAISRQLCDSVTVDVGARQLTTQGANACPFYSSAEALAVACNATAPHATTSLAAADELLCQASSCAVFAFTEWEACQSDCLQHRYRTVQVVLDGGSTPHCVAEIEARACVPAGLTCEPRDERSRAAALVLLAVICGALCVIPVAVVINRKIRGKGKVANPPAAFRRAVYVVEPQVPHGSLPVATVIAAPTPAEHPPAPVHHSRTGRSNRAGSDSSGSTVDDVDNDDATGDRITELPTAIPRFHFSAQHEGSPPLQQQHTDRSIGSLSTASSVPFASSAHRNAFPAVVVPGSGATRRQLSAGMSRGRGQRRRMPVLPRPNFHHPR
jgi:hypothetical protein